MFEWLSLQSARDVQALVSIVGGIGFLTTIIVSSHWLKNRRTELQTRVREAELTLKQEMVERGMSADDIVRVIDAGQKKAAKNEEDVGEPSAAKT